MRKRDEGYVLPYVMVIMLVLAIVASSIMAISLKSLKAQQSSIQRMQDQYTAAGEIEKVVALLENNTPLEDVADICDNTDGVQFDTDTLTLVVTVDDVEIRCVLEQNDTGYSYRSYEIGTVTPTETGVGG